MYQVFGNTGPDLVQKNSTIVESLEVIKKRHYRVFATTHVQSFCNTGPDLVKIPKASVANASHRCTNRRINFEMRNLQQCHASTLHCLYFTFRTGIFSIEIPPLYICECCV